MWPEEMKIALADKSARAIFLSIVSSPCLAGKFFYRKFSLKYKLVYTFVSI